MFTQDTGAHYAPKLLDVQLGMILIANVWHAHCYVAKRTIIGGRGIICAA